MKQLRWFSVFFTALILFIFISTSISTEASMRELSKDEIDTLLSENPFYQSEKNFRPATEYEFNQIAQMVDEKTNENPHEEVDIQEILEELDLNDIGFVKQEEFDKVNYFSSASAGIGSVGFTNYSRTSFNFETAAHVRNVLPLTTLDQIAGFLRGYSILPNANAYVLQHSTYFSELKVKHGLIVVTSVKSVPHFQKDAKFEISAIVNDGGATTSVFNRAISHPNGSFSQ